MSEFFNRFLLVWYAFGDLENTLFMHSLARSMAPDHVSIRLF